MPAGGCKSQAPSTTDIVRLPLAYGEINHVVFWRDLDDCCSSRPEPGSLLGGAPMPTFLQDVRYAFRQFGNHPGFALTAILFLLPGHSRAAAPRSAEPIELA